MAILVNVSYFVCLKSNKKMTKFDNYGSIRQKINMTVENNGIKEVFDLASALGDRGGHKPYQHPGGYRYFVWNRETKGLYSTDPSLVRVDIVDLIIDGRDFPEDSLLSRMTEKGSLRLLISRVERMGSDGMDFHTSHDVDIQHTEDDFTRIQLGADERRLLAEDLEAMAQARIS